SLVQTGSARLAPLRLELGLILEASAQIEINWLGGDERHAPIGDVLGECRAILEHADSVFKGAGHCCVDGCEVLAALKHALPIHQATQIAGECCEVCAFREHFVPAHQATKIAGE